MKGPAEDTGNIMRDSTAPVVRHRQTAPRAPATAGRHNRVAGSPA